jgi:hypothetical protein
VPIAGRPPSVLVLHLALRVCAVLYQSKSLLPISCCYWLGPKGFAYSGRYPTCSEPRIHRSKQVTIRCCDKRACSPKTGQNSLTPVSIFRAFSRSHPLFDNPSKI